MLPGASAMKSLVWLAVTFAVAYLALLLLLRIAEKKFIYFPNFPGRLSGDWRPAALPVEDVWLRAADGVRLHAWWIAAPGAEFTFLAFHGNAANLANRAEIYQLLRELPANVFAAEYRGYGRSAGTPDEPSLYRDAEAAYDYLIRQRNIAPGRIIAFGGSLGTAVAADLASKRAVAGVVLEAPFPSARAVARRLYPFLPGLGLVLRAKFDTAAKLANIRAPVLVIHCSGDPVLPLALGQEVYRQAHEPKFFLRVEGACHETACMWAPEKYRAQLQSFLSQLKTRT
jgi:fermentation-respiration switch protein FrsA (DUF1100 family)